jgi:hypothetical protein
MLVFIPWAAFGECVWDAWMELVFAMGSRNELMTYISCDEYTVGLVGELACHSLSDLVDREPLCRMSATK